MANDEVHKLIQYDVNSPQFLELLENILNHEMEKKSAHSIRDVIDRAKIFSKWTTHLINLSTAKDAKAYTSFCTLIDVIIKVCTYVLENCQDVLTNCEDFGNLLSALKKSIRAAHSKRQVGLNLLYELDELLKVYEVIAAKQKSAPVLKKKTPPSVSFKNNFREVALLPSSREVNQNNFNAISRLLVRGAYECVEKYLNDQFRVLREDFVGTIRIGLKAYREGLARGDSGRLSRYEKIRVYKNVYFEKCEFSKVNSIAYLVNFDPFRRLTTNYETSRVFMHGSLLIFSRNEFRDFFCAIVHYPNVDLLNAGKMYVTVEQNGNFNEDFLYHPSARFAMMESDIFYKPYSSILPVLKNYTEDCFPMREYIVQGSSKVAPPAYLYEFREWNVFGHPTKALDPKTWPKACEIGLDEYQYEALQIALTKKFCVIQGPPGTGKTFLGLKIIRILLENMDKHNLFIRNPILVICFTNHALDQFLEGILEFDSRIIRVGTQSRSELLDQYNFQEKKNLRKADIEMPNEESEVTYVERRTRLMIKRANKEARSILFRIDKLNENLRILSKPKGILSYNCLEEVISMENKEVIGSDDNLFDWLLDEKMKTTYPELMEDFDFLDELDSGIEVSQKALEKEIFGELFRTQERGDIDENANNVDKDEEEDFTHCISLDGLMKVCLHYREELRSIVDRNSLEYGWDKKSLTIKVQRYFILKQNFDKTLVDEVLLQKTSREDLLKLPLDHRWNLYFSWVEAKKKVIKKEIKRLKNEYHSILKEAKNEVEEEDLSIMKTAAVLGMTTTAAAGYHKVIQKLKPSVVIVEEAAQVLEAHIVASLNEFTEHVILIGDHKQLKPFTGVDVLSKKYNLSCSLFERIINNGMHCPTLVVQHRMRPEISSLLRPSIYQNLEDHESVREYESIRGVQKNLFFVDHTSPESLSVEDPTSYQNQHEADFVLELCLYLVNQGYDPESITSLTFYSAQNFLIKQGTRGKLAKIRCCVVDDYQGKENEIIILSLVRSNSASKIGFLMEENRVCVALSRAKKGFYLVGNMSILSQNSSLWHKVRKRLEKDEQIGTKLTLRCSKHDTLTEVTTALDFRAVKGGGCSVLCEDVLPCGHTCLQSCHIADPDHEDEFACKTVHTRTLECGHSATVVCSQKEYSCKEKVPFRSPTCEHTLVRECSDLDASNIICDNVCQKLLRCGHLCPRLCHPNDDHAASECREICASENLDCPVNHGCRRRCGEPCDKCSQSSRLNLYYGRAKNAVQPSEVCGKICPKCLSPCLKSDWEDCSPCWNEVEKIVDECGHLVTVPCSVTPSREMCRTLRNVNKKSICGHDTVYGIPCGVSGTDFEVEDYLLNCEVPCDALLTDCGHKCAGTCGRCVQGRLHVGCGKRCNKDLICGHKCRYACGEICPPCPEFSLLGCEHTTEIRRCGASYTNGCSEPCPYKCEHEACTNACGEMCDREPCYQPCPEKRTECGHPCIGFCGEPCPPVCGVCDADAGVAEHARYIVFEDCGCVFESHVIENELDYQAEALRMYRCPQCDHLILNTRRLMNRVLTKYGQIAALNKRMYDSPDSEWSFARNQIVGKLNEFSRLKGKDLPGFERIREQIRWTLSSEHHSINEQDMVIISYFVDLFDTIDRRLNELNNNVAEPTDTIDADDYYRRGVALVSQVLNRIDMKMLSYDLHAMNGLRGELIRMHRILDYCILLRATSVERLEENPRLRMIRDEIRVTIFEPIGFESDADARLDELFQQFFSIEPKNATAAECYSSDNRALRKMKWTNFLDKLSLNNWYVCRRNHFYRSTLLRDRTCPECCRSLQLCPKSAYSPS